MHRLKFANIFRSFDLSLPTADPCTSRRAFQRSIFTCETLCHKNIRQLNYVEANNAMAAQTGVELSHEEVWDDSDLVQNWNEAFEEYKVCIHACSCTRLVANIIAEISQSGCQRRKSPTICCVESEARSQWGSEHLKHTRELCPCSGRIARRDSHFSAKCCPWTSKRRAA